MREVTQSALDVLALHPSRSEADLERLAVFRIPKSQIPSFPGWLRDDTAVQLALLDPTSGLDWVEMKLMFDADAGGFRRKAGFDATYFFSDNDRLYTESSIHRAVLATSFFIPNTPIEQWGAEVVRDFLIQGNQQTVVDVLREGRVILPNDILDIDQKGRVRQEFIKYVRAWLPGEEEIRRRDEKIGGKTTDWIPVPSERFATILDECLKYISSHPETDITETVMGSEEN